MARDADFVGTSKNPSTEHIANIANKGKNVGNAHRDLNNFCYRHDLMNLEPYDVQCPIRGADGMTILDSHPIFLPHEVAHCVYEADPTEFCERLGAEDDVLRSYWNHHRDSRWLRGHPWVRSIEAKPASAVPP